MSEQSKSEYLRMQAIAQEARNIDYYTNALSVIPNYPENADVRSSYKACLEMAYEHMRDLLHVPD